MKKVGIITLTGNSNFGNKLQSYALNKVISNMGNDTYTIKNYQITNNRDKTIKDYLKDIKNKCLEVKGYILKKDCRKEVKRKKVFTKFDRNIRYYKKVITLKKSKEFNCKFDYFIVGSDQVWNPKYNSLSPVELLEFADEKKRNSYAASFGISDIPKEYEEKAKRELLKFKNISVREEAGKKIIYKLTNRDDIVVSIDPTMLLTGDEWDKISIKPKKIIENEKYILNYFLGELSESRKKEIEKIAQKDNCKIINILEKNDPYYINGPSEFLWLEKHAYLICTDSFHSAVFAILYSKPFVVFNREDNDANMNSRLETLLSKFKLEDRYYQGKITDNLLKCNYTEAYKILEAERKKSRKFLEKALDIK